MPGHVLGRSVETLLVLWILSIKSSFIQGKSFSILDKSVGPGADNGVQAVSPQVTVSHPPGGRLPLYFPPGLRLLPQPQSITALWPLPSYTA